VGDAAASAAEVDLVGELAVCSAGKTIGGVLAGVVERRSTLETELEKRPRTKPATKMPAAARIDVRRAWLTFLF
jgi:hypothetical protein